MHHRATRPTAHVGVLTWTAMASFRTLRVSRLTAKQCARMQQSFVALLIRINAWLPERWLCGLWRAGYRLNRPLKEDPAPAAVVPTLGF